MKEFKGTKGKWEVSPVWSDISEWKVKTEDKVICDVRVIDLYNKDIEAKANAHLIAAAPELLEALNTCLHNLERTNDNRRFDNSINLAKQAINKALNL